MQSQPHLMLKQLRRVLMSQVKVCRVRDLSAQLMLLNR
jgi:hypothetical protein